MARRLCFSLLYAIGVLLTVPIHAAYAQDEGWFFSGGDSSFVLTYTPPNKAAPSGVLLNSPYRFPPDWNPPHRYPDPAANGWNFATNTPSGIVPMEWDDASGQWVGEGTRISQTRIEASGYNTAKLCVHANVGADTDGETEGPYTVSVNVVALPGGASLSIYLADSGSGDLPDMTTAMDLLGYPIILSGGQPCSLKLPPVTISECQWIVFEVDDPTPDTPTEARTWGRLRALYH